MVLLLTVLLCTLPMGASPYWNGKITGHRNQYEVLAEAFIDGHVYVDYGDHTEDGLTALDQVSNVYSTKVRQAAQVDYHWDHAFYKGHYYVYFGVVPVVLLFLPFRLLTGYGLTTYHATQIFTALFILGVFAFFFSLAKRFFRKMSYGMFLALCSAFSVMSVWYAVGAPALYGTAITAGLCMEIWSFFFFFKAVYGEINEKKRLHWAFWGSLFGALAFGCRPPIALANLLVLPLLIEYLRGRKWSLRLCGQLVAAACPYVFVAAGLMAYNAMRFDNPFEFGQAYQLTLTDQTGYLNIFSLLRPSQIIKGIWENFFGYTPPDDAFPYLNAGGAVLNFPILIFPVVAFFHRGTRIALREARLYWFAAVLALIPLLISAVDAVYSPTLLERYRMDIYWLMAILTFLSLGFFYSSSTERQQQIVSRMATTAAVFVLITCVLFYLKPDDSNVTNVYPEILDAIRKLLTFWRT
ncbi:MAG: hypothetical protein PHI98_04190 [Eubacteriales bacterium]|nr:hypothetical protein [Eubacteriales bacterium]